MRRVARYRSWEHPTSFSFTRLKVIGLAKAFSHSGHRQDSSTLGVYANTCLTQGRGYVARKVPVGLTSVSLVGQSVEICNRGQVHAFLVEYLRKKMPTFMGKDKEQAKLIANITNVYQDSSSPPPPVFPSPVAVLARRHFLCRSPRPRRWHRVKQKAWRRAASVPLFLLNFAKLRHIYYDQLEQHTHAHKQQQLTSRRRVARARQPPSGAGYPIV